MKARTAIATCWGCGETFTVRTMGRRQQFCMDPRCRHLRVAYAALNDAHNALDAAGRHKLANACIVLIGHVMKHAPSRATR